MRREKNLRDVPATSTIILIQAFDMQAVSEYNRKRGFLLLLPSGGERQRNAPANKVMIRLEHCYSEARCRQLLHYDFRL